MRRRTLGSAAITFVCVACGKSQGNDDLFGPSDHGSGGTATTESGGTLGRGGAVTTSGGKTSAASGANAGGAAATGGKPSTFGGSIGNAGTPATTGGKSSAAGGSGGSTEAGQGGVVTIPSKDQCSLVSSVAMPAPEQMFVSGGTLKSDEHDCKWGMTKSEELPVPTDSTRLLFHYDVNGDSVDDLFFGHPWSQEGGDAPVTVMHSHFNGKGVLTFEPADCELSLPLGDRTYFVRDLNRDQTLDLVIGTGDGVRALVNGEDGPESALEYHFPNSEGGVVSVLDVAVGDFDADGSDDLAIGFDRAMDPLGTLQTGTLVFSDIAGGGLDNEPLALRTTNWAAATVGAAAQPPPELGYLTTFAGGKALFGLITREGGGTDGWVYRDGKLSPLPITGTLLTTANFVQNTVLDDHEQLFIGAGTLHAFDPLVPEGPGVTHYDGPGAFEHNLLDRELGGGTRERSFFLLDLDGDGDDDLVERNNHDRVEPSDGGSFAFHTGVFGDFVEFYLIHYTDPGSESPFLAIGELEGRLLVSGAAPDFQIPRPTLRSLTCTE